MHYAKRHPMKVFLLAIMPLITGGALTALLARFGLRLPHSIERMLGMASKAASGDSFGVVTEAMKMASGGGFGGGDVKIRKGRDGNMQWERSTYREDDGWGGGFGNVASVAKMFF